MSLITRISLLNHPGVLRDFRWPADLPDFGRFNLIYGWNGSGKTTISRMFRALETRTNPPIGKVRFTINGAELEPGDADWPAPQVRVFNRDFVEESVLHIGSSEMPPILILGKESVEKQKELERLKTVLANAEDDLRSAQEKAQEAESQLDNFNVHQAKTIKGALRSSGSNPYNNYDKSNFRNRAQEMLDAGDKETHRLSDPDREKLRARLSASSKQRIQPVAYSFPALQRLSDVATELLSTTVVSATVRALRDDPGLSEWVHQGLNLHKKRRADRCLFCEQPLPSERLTALEAHFNTEYERLMKRLDAEIASLRGAAKEGAELRVPSPAELYDDLADEYSAAAAALREMVDSALTFLESLEQCLTEKKAKPFEKLELTVRPPEVDYEAVGRLNDVIRKHNQACDDPQEGVTKARELLEADFVAQVLEEYEELRNALLAAETNVEEATAATERLKQSISDLERQILEHRRPAEELNDDLQKYLGHCELRLEIKDTGYELTRNGTPARALSEGETTAIALLYFLKSLADRRFDLKKGVVVLDDPVSSLDANALHLAVGFIRERTRDAGQLFILTHNFTFFREIRSWFSYINKRNGAAQQPAHFYMLECRCSGDGEARCSSIRPLDPLLERYESEYHYLFAQVYRAAKYSECHGLECNYVLPNIARRVLEAFLAFHQPANSGNLWQQMRNCQFDKARANRIYRFVNMHSHASDIGEPEHDLSILSETRPVLEDLLEFIKKQNPQHYDAMEKLVNLPTEK